MKYQQSHDIAMMLQLQAVMATPQNFIKYAAIRSVEKNINKNMQDFGEDAIVTLCDLTRWLRKNEPDVLRLIDQAIEKMDQEVSRKPRKYFYKNNHCLNCHAIIEKCCC